MSLLRADFTSHDYAPHTHHAFVIAVTEAGGAEINSARGVEWVCQALLWHHAAAVCGRSSSTMIWHGFIRFRSAAR